MNEGLAQLYDQLALRAETREKWLEYRFKALAAVNPTRAELVETIEKVKQADMPDEVRAAVVVGLRLMLALEE